MVGTGGVGKQRVRRWNLGDVGSDYHRWFVSDVGGKRPVGLVCNVGRGYIVRIFYYLEQQRNVGRQRRVGQQRDVGRQR